MKKKRRKQDPPLSKADMLIIRQVYFAFARYGIPFLPAPKWCYRAKALADRRLLKAHPLNPMPDTGKDSDWARFGFTPTRRGVLAYNAIRRTQRRWPTSRS
jgi:hypothetical protein